MTVLRLPRAARLAALVLFVTLPVLARSPHAPDGQYAQFDSSAKTITDVQTRLVWERNVVLTTMTWEDADKYCRLTYGGRLPTIKELLTLVDEEPHSEYDGEVVNTFIDPDAFGNGGSRLRTPLDAPYWTTTPAKQSAMTVWTLNFETGLMEETPRAVTRHLRCVKTSS